MSYYGKALSNLSGNINFKFTSDSGDTRFLNLNYESIDALRKFLDKKEGEMELLEQFLNMDKEPIFEITKADYISGEDAYEVINIVADSTGLSAMGMGITVEWDVDFTLDEHLQDLHEKCIIEGIK